MPELPEVETTRRGVEPWCINQKISGVDIWQSALRWPIPAEIKTLAPAQCIHSVQRRAKYLLFDLDTIALVVHLGMSGSLRVVAPQETRRKHDHWQLSLSNGKALRYHDPRRFGALLCTQTDTTSSFPLLVHLGPEPLEDSFNGDYLYKHASKRRQPVKNFIMDGKIVVGVGNIYASEALFLAGIHPARSAGRISLKRYHLLSSAIKEVLNNAIEQGGTTLRDYVNGSGQPGYFQQKLLVYGRSGKPCNRCATKIKAFQLGQRSSYFCPTCQH